MPRRPLTRCAAGYVIVTAVMGWDLLRSLGSTIASDAGDPMLNASILAWNAITLPWSPGWYQFPIFHPASGALAFSEHLLGVSVIATPVYWATGNGLTAYNLTLLLTYPLCALSMCVLVWRLTRSAPAAFLSGLAFGFAPYRAAQLPHVQVLAVFWAPLALLGLHAFLDAPVRRGRPPEMASSEPGGPPRADRRWWWLVLFAVSWLLQGAANLYFLVYFSLVVGLWVLWFGVARRRWREVAMIAGAVALAVLPLVPILYRYWLIHERYGFARGIEEVRRLGADIMAPLCPATGLTFWGWLGGPCDAEGELFIGPTLVALCCIGVWAAVRAGRSDATSGFARMVTSLARLLMVASVPFLAGGIAVVAYGPWAFSLGPVRATGSEAAGPFTTGLLLLLPGVLASRSFRAIAWRNSAAAFYVVAAFATWALSWGPEPRLWTVPVLTDGPFAWLRIVPGVDGLRVPARFWMMTVLCLCVLMGSVIAHWLKGRSPRSLLAIMTVASAGLLVDGWMPIPAAVLPPPAPNPDVLRGGAVIVLPLGPNDSTAEFRAIVGGWSSVNGASGHDPPHYEMLREASNRADPILFEPFVEDLHVVVNDAAAALIELIEHQPGVEPTGRGNGQRQYRIPGQGQRAFGSPAGERLPIASVSASCAQESVALALDGDLTSRWHCGAQTADRQVTIDLGTVAGVGAVTVAVGAFSTDYPRRLVVETSEDGRNWQAAWTGSGLAAMIEADQQDPPATPVTVTFAGRQARYIRLRQIGRNETWYWTIAELEVRSGSRGE